MRVPRVLLTGMSGVGKSSTVAELQARGWRAVDLDDPQWSVDDDDGDWIWRADRVTELLADDGGGEVLFVSGCASNQGRFHDRFDEIVLLSAPTDVLVERLATRTTNAYGKDPAELTATLGYVETVEPLLRAAAGHQIDTTVPLDDVVAQVLRIAGVDPP